MICRQLFGPKGAQNKQRGRRLGMGCNHCQHFCSGSLARCCKWNQCFLLEASLPSCPPPPQSMPSHHGTPAGSGPWRTPLPASASAACLPRGWRQLDPGVDLLLLCRLHRLLGLQVMGRPVKKWWTDARMKAAWAQGMNGKVRRSDVPTSSDVQYYWHASCGRHYRLLQVDSVQQALKQQADNGSGSNSSSGGSSRSSSSGGSSGLRCPICQPLSTELSRHVQPVRDAADATGQLWLAEHHCLPGRCSPADIWLPAYRLAIQVDGAGHTDVAVYSKTLAQQQRTDAYFDNEVVRQGLRALRIHWRDAANPAATLAAAMQECINHPAATFVMYSSSYKRPTKRTIDVEHWEEVDKRQRQQRTPSHLNSRCAPCTCAAAPWCP